MVFVPAMQSRRRATRQPKAIGRIPMSGPTLMGAGGKGSLEEWFEIAPVGCAIDDAKNWSRVTVVQDDMRLVPERESPLRTRSHDGRVLVRHRSRAEGLIEFGCAELLGYGCWRLAPRLTIRWFY